MPVEEATTARSRVHHGTVRVAAGRRLIAEDLEMVSLTQILAWDLPLEQLSTASAGRRTRARHAAGHGVAGRAARRGGDTADVLLRYNFPGGTAWPTTRCAR